MTVLIRQAHVPEFHDLCIAALDLAEYNLLK